MRVWVHLSLWSCPLENRIVIIVFAGLSFYLLCCGCPQCAFLPAAVVALALLCIIAGKQWRIASVDFLSLLTSLILFLFLS